MTSLHFVSKCVAQGRPLCHVTVMIWNISLRWRHNGRDDVSNHQPHDCLLNCLFRRRSKKTSKLRVTGLCGANSPGTGEFPAQMASNAENVSISWRHHVPTCIMQKCQRVGRCSRFYICSHKRIVNKIHKLSKFMPATRKAPVQTIRKVFAPDSHYKECWCLIYIMADICDRGMNSTIERFEMDKLGNTFYPLWCHQMETFPRYCPFVRLNHRSRIFDAFCCQSKQTAEQTLDWPVIRDVMTVIWRRRNVQRHPYRII